ncbi:mercuric reductase [Thalassoroseus pseudoceratinae]|uniref:mercuric reductase n=1 Tax=Thalassoroseus pseudoceratinae TaxID=2713176 RepID=UPI00141E0571|nr:mercuric reductase [Thalassoroseus pseudoceratinae]
MTDDPTREPSFGEIRPDDEHNRRLKSHVHPPDWTNPTPNGRYNLVVIGAGTAGLVTAMASAGLGAKVALVERHLMGGDCLNVGCVPSKAVLAAARVAATVRDGNRFGMQGIDDVQIDFPAVMERLRRLRADIAHVDSAKRFQDAGVDVYLGDGQFQGDGKLEVAGTTLSFKKAVIATGARAVIPEIPGLQDAGCLTNETVFSLTELPRRLAIIGGGPIGCEMAQAFARLGSDVTLLEKSSRILRKDEADAAQIIQDALKKDGVSIRFETEVSRIETVSDGKQLELKTATSSDSIVVDEILIGAGRQPNVEELNLESVGVEYDDRHGVKVDDRLQTSNRNVFAAGDVCSKFKFTHAADFMARTVVRNALFWGRSKVSDLTIPWCTYTSPELAHVGLTPEDAESQNIEIDTYTQELAEVDRAILDGETNGFVRVHTKAGSDRILGATIVAEHAGDFIGEIVTAMQGGIGLGKLANAIHPYPTQAEAIRKLGDQYNRSRLTPFVKSIFRRLLAWQR